MSEALAVAVAALAGAGAAMVIGAGLSGLLTFLERAWLLRHSAGYRAAAMRQARARREDPFGLDLLPWPLIRAGGVVLLALIALATQPALLALAPAGWMLPELFLRRFLEARARSALRLEARDALMELRLLMAVGTSLGPALDIVARSGEGVLRRALREELGGDVYGRLPEQVLREVAGKLGSAELRQALARLESAQRGTETYASALSEAVAEISERIAEEAEVAVEGAPTRFILPMLACLMGPLLVIAIYPPLAGVVASITGTGAMGR